jgi:Dullard-like phosphatase family protein
MITPFTSPISDKIFMAYDTKIRHKGEKQTVKHSPLEHEDEPELKGTVFREFTIHIFQSINFLQTLEID